MKRGEPRSTVDQVVAELRDRYSGQWVRALDLQMVEGGNAGLRASIQSISNSLRHAHQMRLVRRRPVPGLGNTSEWSAA